MRFGLTILPSSGPAPVQLSWFSHNPNHPSTYQTRLVLVKWPVVQANQTNYFFSYTLTATLSKLAPAPLDDLAIIFSEGYRRYLAPFFDANNYIYLIINYIIK